MARLCRAVGTYRAGFYLENDPPAPSFTPIRCYSPAECTVVNAAQRLPVGRRVVAPAGHEIAEMVGLQPCRVGHGAPRAVGVDVLAPPACSREHRASEGAGLPARATARRRARGATPRAVDAEGREAATADAGPLGHQQAPIRRMGGPQSAPKGLRWPPRWSRSPGSEGISRPSALVARSRRPRGGLGDRREAAGCSRCPRPRARRSASSRPDRGSGRRGGRRG